MKIFLMLSFMILFFACATKHVTESSGWSGAQRQETMQDENHSEQQEQFRNQFPSTQGNF